MNLLFKFLNFFLNIDKHLLEVVSQYGTLTYFFVFLIVFMETGFVVTPFLPGDSLLFAAGAIAGAGPLNIFLLWTILFLAAFLGDTVNYWIGHFIGPKVFEKKSKIFKKEYLAKAQHFYDKHGGKAIFLARFVPIVRTFAPFIAGVGKMKYFNFILFNVLGGIVWVSLFLFSGFFFGGLPIVKENFHYVVVVIILLSLIPIIYEWHKARKEGSIPKL